MGADRATEALQRNFAQVFEYEALCRGITQRLRSIPGFVPAAREHTGGRPVELLIQRDRYVARRVRLLQRQLGP